MDVESAVEQPSIEPSVEAALTPDSESSSDNPPRLSATSAIPVAEDESSAGVAAAADTTEAIVLAEPVPVEITFIFNISFKRHL